MNATSRRSAAKSEEQGPWLSTSFANLVRYQPSGAYFSRLQVAGKLIRRSLKTFVLSVGKLRLQEKQWGQTGMALS